MSHADRLIGFLSHARASDGAAVDGWRFELAESEAVRLGVRSSEAGGPYESPGIALRLAASLDLHWSDGRVTRTTADRRAIMEPAAHLAEWREIAVRPRGSTLPPLAGPVDLPRVDVFDAGIASGVSADPSALMRLMSLVNSAMFRCGALRTDAVLRATLSRRTVATSRGFRADWQDTLLTLGVWADELGGALFDRRQFPTGEQAAQLAHEATTLAGRLGRTDELPSSARGILFAPPAVDQLLARFVLPNLAGRAIRDGRSFFSRADLEARRQVAQAGLTLSIDTTLPFEPASAPCSPDGVPAARVDVIADGRLRAPVVDLESAAELGYQPTPRPRGRPLAILSTIESPLDWDAALQFLGAGVIIRDLPGLHTQAARRAEYALVTPDAQVVADGRAGGRCAVRLAGNVFDHVSQASSRLVRAPGASGVGLLVVDGVDLRPA